tara:strand:+ start:151 stop:378 length:228 start_codon:yes stop_codon:yes gene_type:complete
MNNKKLQKLLPEISKLIGKHNTPPKLENTAIELMDHGVIEYIGYPKPIWRITINGSVLLAGASGYFEKTTNHTPH